jgi:O-antigen ligase
LSSLDNSLVNHHSLADQGRRVARPPLFVFMGFLFLATADGAARIILGGLTGPAVISLVTAGLLCIATVYNIARHKALPLVSRNWRGVPLAWGLWLGWCLFTTILHGLPQRDGQQNLAVFSVLVLGVYVTSKTFNIESLPTVSVWMFRASSVLALLFSYQVVRGGYGSREVGFLGNRSFALVALIPIVWCSAHWVSSTGRERFVVWILMFEMAISGSRTGLVLALIFIGANSLSAANRRGRLLVRIVVAVIVLEQLITRWAPLKARFTEGDAAFHVGSITINTEGRMLVWENLWAEYHQAAWTGSGLGHAAYSTKVFAHSISQPHNDYLRILVDQGLIGLILFALGCLVLLVRLSRYARNDGQHRSLHLAAAMSLVSLMSGMMTDNPLIYIFVIIPTAGLIGVSLAVSREMLLERATLHEGKPSRKIDTRDGSPNRSENK